MTRWLLRPRNDPALVAGWIALLLTVILVPASLWLMPYDVTSDPVNDVFIPRLIRASGLVLGPVGLLIAVHRRANRIAWILIGLGLLVPGSFAAGDASRVVTEPRATAILGEVGQLGWWTFIMLVSALVLLYPDGRLPSRRWLPLGWALACQPVVTLVADLLAPTTYNLGVIGPNQTTGGAPGVIGEFGQLLVSVSGPLTIPIFVGVVVAALTRWRRSAGVERQQLDLFAYVVLIIVGGFLLAFVTKQGLWVLLDIPLALIALPITIAAAIFRYRLYEIEVLIKRTLVYGATTAAIAAAFFGGIVILQTVLRQFTGGSELAVALSTLVSFALFQPLRRKVQETVDRRFYRARYDAARTVDKFSVRLRDEVDLDAVGSDLIDVVRGTMQPEHVSLWLRETVR